MRILFVLLTAWVNAFLSTTATAQIPVDLVVEGTSNATEETPSALVAVNDDFDEKNEIHYAAPAGIYTNSFVVRPTELEEYDNRRHDPTGAGGDHRIKSDADHSNKDGDDNELADAKIVISGPAGTSSAWQTELSVGSGEVKVWWYDGMQWVEVDNGLIVTTFTPTPPITLPANGLAETRSKSRASSRRM